MGVFKRGKRGTWYYEIYHKGRRIRKAVGPSKRLALIEMHKKRVELAEDRLHTPHKREKVLFRQMVKLYLELHSKPHKRPESYKRDLSSAKNLNVFFGGRYLHQVSPIEIERFKAMRLRQGVSYRTVDVELSLLSHLFTKAVDWNKIDNNPMKRVKLFRRDIKRNRYLDPEKEYPTLLCVSNEPLKSMIRLSISTALRKSNLIYLKRKDVDARNHIIYIKQMKAREPFALPITDFSLSIIQAQPNYGPYVFSKKNGESYGDPKKAFRQALKKVGIEDFRWHDLRHTAGSYLAMRGVPIKAIQVIMGHKRIETTMRYAHLSPEYTRQGVETLSDYIQKIEKTRGIVTATKTATGQKMKPH